MNQDELHEKKWKERRDYDTWHSEHMKQAQLGWTEIQAKSINDHINLHVEYMKKEMEKENGNS
jgi:predicted aminopeptidase